MTPRFLAAILVTVGLIGAVVGGGLAALLIEDTPTPAATPSTTTTTAPQDPVTTIVSPWRLPAIGPGIVHVTCSVELVDGVLNESASSCTRVEPKP